MSNGGPAYQQLADRLRAEILSGELAPGSRLPAEAELTERLGVSRSTVREALRVLASQRLIVTTRGVTGGSFVTAPAAADVQSFLEASFGLMSGGAALSVAELLEVRELLEVPAAGLAAQRRNATHLDALRATIAAVSVPISQTSPVERFEANRDFHLHLADAAGNRAIAMLVRPTFTVLQNRYLSDEPNAQEWAKVASDHEEICAAVEVGDAGAASDAMRRHLGALHDTHRMLGHC